MASIKMDGVDSIEKLARALPPIDVNLANKIGALLSEQVLAGVMFGPLGAWDNVFRERAEAIARSEMCKAYDVAHDAMVAGTE